MPYGNFFLSRGTLNADDAHGHWRICDFAQPSMKAAAFLIGNHASEDLSIAGGLFLDTETTGLAGGTGTFPFLIGLGWFEAGAFITCQLFARDFSEERAMLTYLSELASTKQFLVTFNGKAYDLNLLTARFILNRCQDTLSAMPHIDLLHPSRRIFSHRLENTRLVNHRNACARGESAMETFPVLRFPNAISTGFGNTMEGCWKTCSNITD